MNPLAWQGVVEHSLGLQNAHWTSSGHSGWGQSFSLAAGSKRYFVKTASGRFASTVEAEADGLAALATTRTIRVPHVVVPLTSGDTSILVLEWLDLRGSREGAALGRLLAAQHRAPTPHGPAGERFGWHRDNWIGGTPQPNGWNDDWCAFFRDRRLAPQLERAARKGVGAELERAGERLLRELSSLLGGCEAQPSLLHGDLWSGNAATLTSGEAVVFDPAVYVGDRDADLAMTELFGGFGADFYAAYREAWPLDPDYAVRRDVYKLYHVLNHFNLFGGGYLGRAKALMARLGTIVG